MSSTWSPYAKHRQKDWKDITDSLLASHPLDMDEIVDVVRASWSSIFHTTIGASKFKLGRDIKPQPQMMGFFLHELIPLEFQARHPGVWRRQDGKNERDIVCVPDRGYSIELKTSSNRNQVFGNRSYGQPPKDQTPGVKGKFGYYLTANFERFHDADDPDLRIIRFGWLDHEDWIPQRSQTGQQARLRPEAYQFKLRVLWERTRTR